MDKVLRREFDVIFDEFVAKQSVFTRKAVAGKREDVWVAMCRLIAPYHADALKYRATQDRAAADERLDRLTGGKF